MCLKTQKGYIGDAIFLLIVVTIVVAAIAALWIGMDASTGRDKRLLAECMKDHKEYECVAMLRKNETTVVPVPVIISR